PVRALAADQLPLHDGHPQPVRGDRGGAVLAGRPTTQDDHVELAHEPSSQTLVGRARGAAVSPGELASSLTSPPRRRSSATPAALPCLLVSSQARSRRQL